MNKIRINSLNENVNTITHEKNKEKEKDTKFIRCKKEILENMTKSLGIEQILKKKKMKIKLL